MEEPLFSPKDSAFMDKYQQWQKLEAFLADFQNPGVGLVKREDLRRELESLYRRRNGAAPESAARQFLDDVRGHAGLLLERGPGEYGFIHMTFEEYLAAVAIALLHQGDAEGHRRRTRRACR